MSLVAGAIAIGSSAQAGVIATSLYGDVDCFGTNQVCNDGVRGSGTFSDFNDFNAAMVADSTPLTDRWPDVFDSQSWEQSISNTGAATEASLDLRVWAMADIGNTYDVQVNGVSVGTIDTVTAADTYLAQQVRNLTFLFSAALVNDGVNTISLINDGSGDNWSLDFSRLSLLGASEVPLPAALPLFLMGLAGLGAARRKRQS